MVVGVFRFGLGDLTPVARAKVVAAMQDGVMILDSQMRVVDCNQAAETLFGFDRSCVGRSADELFANHPKLLRLLERQQQNTDLIYSGIGNTVQRISSEMLSDNSLRLLMLRDLSADSKIQDALRLVVERTSQDVGEDFFRSLTRTLALDVRYAMVGVIAENGDQVVETLAFWDTDTYLENFSYELAETPCERVTDSGTCVYPEDVKALFPMDIGLRDFNVEGYLGTPLLSHTGEVVGLLTVMDDKPMDHVEFAITLLEIVANRAAAELERRASEKELIESRQSYLRIVESTEDGVCLTDAQGFIQFVNQPMSDIIGDDEILDKKLWALLDIGATEGYMDGNRVECRIVNPSGRECWVHISKTMIEDDATATTGMLYLFNDVSEEKSLAEINEKIEQQLQQAQKMESLGVLAGGVAHDFNNLLIPILGYLDLIKQKSNGDSLITDYVQRIQHAGGKLAELCNQMLTCSGKGYFIEFDVEVNDQIKDMQQLIRASVPRKFTIEYELESNLPSVWGDGTQLSQVLMNLLINAGEAMNLKDEGKIVISTGSEVITSESLSSLYYGEQPSFGQHIYIDVSDEGVGLSEEDSSRLFEPFYATKFTGRGLGMAIVYGIMRAPRWCNTCFINSGLWYANSSVVSGIE